MAELTTVYKLTDTNGQTLNSTQWGVRVIHRIKSRKKCQPCTPTAIHAYRDPELALAFNPIHGNYQMPRLWRGEMRILGDDGRKVWGKQLTIMEELPVNRPSEGVLLMWAILLAYPSGRRVSAWREWADNYIAMKISSAAAAHAAAAARATYAAAAAHAAYAAAYAAAAADAAAHAAAHAAAAADAAHDTYFAVWRLAKALTRNR